MNNVEELIDTADLARILNVTRTYVTDKLTKHPSFPRPAINLNRRVRRWDKSEVMAWLANGGK